MDHTFFVVQVFLDLPYAGALHATMRDQLQRAPEKSGFDQKNHYYRAIGGVLVPWTPHFKRGVWDYVEDPTNAMTEWTGWTSGTLEDARAPRDDNGPYRSGARSMFVTLAFLLQKGGITDKFVCERCRIDENAMWTRQTFMYLLTAPQNFHFPSVRGDAMFVRPGLAPDHGVTEEELGEEHYEYVKTLT